jgi:hypothetical protein
LIPGISTLVVMPVLSGVLCLILSDMSGGKGSQGDSEMKPVRVWVTSGYPDFSTCMVASYAVCASKRNTNNTEIFLMIIFTITRVWLSNQLYLRSYLFIL